MKSAHTSQCRDFLGSLSDFLDGTLQAELCQELEAHMSECENCRIVVDTLRKTISLYRADGSAADLPPDVRERLFRRLDLEAFARRA